MSNIVDQIKAPITLHMDEFEIKFKQSMKSSVPLLDKITNYIVKRKGKQIRPMFVFLSAQAQVYSSTHQRLTVNWILSPQNPKKTAIIQVRFGLPATAIQIPGRAADSFCS